MPIQGIDVSVDTTGSADDVQKAGYGALGFYARPDRASKAMIDGLHEVGIKVWRIYEQGYPTSPAYFSAAQGTADGKAAAYLCGSTGYQGYGAWSAAASIVQGTSVGVMFGGDADVVNDPVGVLW